MTAETVFLLLFVAGVSFAFGRLFGRHNVEDAVAKAVDRERKRQENLSPLERVLGEEPDD